MIHQEKNKNGSGIVHRAKWVILDPWTIIRDGFVKTENGIIAEIGSRTIPSGFPVKDHGEGALIPAVINAHTHLELSAFRGKVPCQNGFRTWVEKLLQEREKAEVDTLKKAARDEILELQKTGCVAAAEVSTLGLTRHLFFESGICGIWFKEVLGDCKKEIFQMNHLSSTEKMKLSGKNGEPPMLSFAVHAPHTTSSEVICDICKRAGKMNLPYSIHLAESDDEIEFITTGRGPWADFLASRNIRFSDWKIPAKSPVSYLHTIGALNKNTIAVHVLRVDKADLQILAFNNVRVCLCPRSNYNLFGIFPDIKTMLQMGLRPCLGTDSLASVDTLSIFDEMSFVRDAYPDISSSYILAMATLFGAQVLGIDSYVGSLFPGKKAAMVFVPVDSNKVDDIIDTIVYHDFDEVIPVF